MQDIILLSLAIVCGIIGGIIAYSVLSKNKLIRIERIIDKYNDIIPQLVVGFHQLQLHENERLKSEIMNTPEKATPKKRGRPAKLKTAIPGLIDP